MSDMIINDSVPVDKKWNELIRYNIFVMKLVEFVISLVTMLAPFILGQAGIMHCLAVSPTLVLSLLFIILYLVDQVHDLAELLYLVNQIIMNILAIVFALLSRNASTAVIALLLNIISHVLDPVDALYCLVAGPTLMVSLLFMILYVVDQVQYEAEMYFVIIQTTITFAAFVNVCLVGKLQGAIYGLFYVDLLVALLIDLRYIQKERGWTF